MTTLTLIWKGYYIFNMDVTVVTRPTSSGLDLEDNYKHYPPVGPQMI